MIKDGWYRRTEPRYIYLLQYKDDRRVTWLKYCKGTKRYNGYFICKRDKHETMPLETVHFLWRDNWLDSLPLPKEIEI